MPQDFPLELSRQFFEQTYKFLNERYSGEQNVVSAYVHMDEKTPHMHYAFVPVVHDKKKNKEIANDIVLLRNGDPSVSIHSVYVKATRKKREAQQPIKPSRGLEGKVKSSLKSFAALVNDFPEKSDGIYIYDTMIEWAKEKRAKLKQSKQSKGKSKKSSSKK